MSAASLAYAGEISPTSTLCDRDSFDASPKLSGEASPSGPLSHLAEWFQRSRTSSKTRSSEPASPTRRSPSTSPAPVSVISRRPLGYAASVYGPALRCLGAGTNGVVSLHCPSGDDSNRLAVKRLVIPSAVLQSTNRAQRYVRQVLHEASLTRTFDHPNVIANYDYFQEDDGVFYSVMDYCPLDLFTLVQGGNLGLAEVRCYFAQLVHGLYYLHVQRRVAHRDLKLDNVCITSDGVVKVIDFGCATTSHPKYDPQQQHTSAILATGTCGSDTYMAPELFATGPNGGVTVYDARKVDVWALAIIYIAMCTKHFPWDRATLADPNFALFTRHPRPILQRMLPHQPEVVPILAHMLALNPNERPSVPSVMATPWFQSIQVCQPGLCVYHAHEVPADLSSAA
ncbi:hypothetical protein IWQ60_002150 [Tieghemiomyces parasiticus]|uniref:Protein kinase domain-containing protein n=1 Tax=Tieghemiomyces parasiticus TaxID=78921 RepID=A0A9W8ACP2_9FUNG|nr:hypothetical protein IWQ60_002150 [Tieghemiomyces parasiticus]